MLVARFRCCGMKAHQQDGGLGVAQHLLGNAAKKPAPKAAAPMRSHHHQTSVVPLYTVFYRGSRRTNGAFRRNPQPSPGYLLLFAFEIALGLLDDRLVGIYSN